MLILGSENSTLDRQHALRLLGAIGGAVALGKCSGGGTTPAVAAATAAASSGAASTCVKTDEGEIGPYFTDDSLSGYNRSNITTNIDGTSAQGGIPLTLNVSVYDAQNNCAAVAGSQVDIWHCNASGVYSNESVESTVGQTWLRGYQVTNAAGLVTFVTIVPGWYQGRTTHVHLRVRSSYSEASSTSDGTNTTQLFFPQAMIDSINTSVAPYSAHGTNPTTNAIDHVDSTEMHATSEVTLAGSYTAGFTATFSIFLPITAA